ncbi:isoprenoid synthase domain-containing protein [Podospora fimiseda]|uniref:Isoprenoid synthase domain-containing protein n=1 Tax=Podospora fimiseda TaxID=252190 RepID=A0AAN6YPQ9_9PEZI|nr:isoprenoid synthase domain-containing protein [Podospora fimiseda]
MAPTRYSSVLDPSEYGEGNTHGLLDSIQIRIGNKDDRADLGSISAIKDWQNHVDPTIGFYAGTLHRRMHLIHLAIPDCIPERLFITAYATEFSMLSDDFFENAEHTKAIESRDGAIVGLNASDTMPVNSNKDMQSERAKGIKKLQSWLISEMMAIDPERAMLIVKVWTEYLKEGSCLRVEDYNVADYVEYRLVNVGGKFWEASIKFGTGITIPDHEKQISDDICRDAWIAMALINDLYSWEKEFRVATELKLTGTFNVIWIIMREQGVDVEAAKQVCISMIKEYIQRLQLGLKKLEEKGESSADLFLLIEGVKSTVWGGALWSMGCPRYNSSAKFNEQQLEWLANGIPDHLQRNLRRVPLTISKVQRT